MTEVKKFSDFGIAPITPSFTGQKINILAVLNCEIKVLDYSIQPSKYAGKGDYLKMQIEHAGEKRVIFIGSKSLIQMIEKVPKDSGFPFQTKVIKKDLQYQFS